MSCNNICELPKHPNNICESSNSICDAICDKNKGYKLKKNVATIKFNDKTVTTNKVSTMVYNPLIMLNGDYDCRCRKFMKGSRCCHCHYYYSKFTIYNNNEYFLHNTKVNIRLSSGPQYIMGTLKINDISIDDTKPIVIESIAPYEVVTISFYCVSEIINEQIYPFIEEIEVNSSFIGFNNIPKYFHAKKDMNIDC